MTDLLVGRANHLRQCVQRKMRGLAQLADPIGGQAFLRSVERLVSAPSESILIWSELHLLASGRRPAAPRRAALLVELSADGRLTNAPQAVRRQGAAVDPQALLAERAALRALQACAPYPGLGRKRWRVEFP